MSTDAQGKVLYTASADATIKSWNILTGQVLKVGSISVIRWDVFNKKVQSLDRHLIAIGHWFRHFGDTTR